MGVSTDAILFYGHVFDTEGCVPWETDDEDDNDWEDRYAAARGLSQPSEAYPQHWPGPTGYSPEEQRILSLWFDYWAACRKLVEECPCEILTHCSADYPMPYVAIKASRQCANRGGPVEATTENEDSLDWDEQIQDFCTLMGIETEAPPRWWLVSYWG